MEIKKLIATGEIVFLDRYRSFFVEISKHIGSVKYIPRKKLWYEYVPIDKIIKVYLAVRAGSVEKVNSLFSKNKKAFILRSRQLEQEISSLSSQPDLIFHVFCLYRPFRKKPNIPFVILLDYTTALAERNWNSWAPFINQQSRNAWFECESSTFSQAKHIFSMSQVVKESLMKDYQIPEEKITVIGSSGNFGELYAGKKTFGSKQILFNGSDFKRKGGELVLDAFPQVRRLIPDAKLVILGGKVSVDMPGVINPGNIASRSEMNRLFLESDLVVAPALCDPFPAFLMEAMNYGVPCVVSDRDGMPEIVDHNLTGIVVKDLDPNVLAKEIAAVLTDQARLESMSDAARQKIKDQMNWESIARHVKTTLDEIP